MKLIFIFTFLLVLCSCSRVSLIRLETNPEGAAVFARALGSNDKKELGKTPFSMDSKEIQDKLATKGFIIVSIEKDSYYKKEFYITDFTSRDFSATLNLKAMPVIEQGHKVDEMVAKFFNCQKLVKSKKFKDCREILKELKGKYPEVSSIYEFEGSLFYLENQKRKALDSFITALKYNPKNTEAQRMIKIIKQEAN